MVEMIVNFIYKGKEIKMQCKSNDYMKDIIQSYIIKSQLNYSDIYFLYNGEKINENLKLEEINNKDKEIKILVYELNNKDENNKNMIQKAFDIICPKCRENCLITIEDYKISLFKCDNGHNESNLLISEYNSLLNIDESNILCYNCKEDKKNVYKNQFYYCCKCNINLCPLCKSKHNDKHIIIDYELKNYLCYEHGERYTSYCQTCCKNLCDLCEIEHNRNHNFIYHREIQRNEEKENLSELKIKIDILKEEISEIINKLNETMKNMDIYYDIAYNIINNYNIKYKNYQILMNINNINKSNINVIKDIDKIIKEKKIENKLMYLEQINKRMETKNEILIKYKIKEEDEIIRIFGDEFVEKNKNNFQMIIDEEIYDLDNILYTKNFEIKNEILELKLKEIKNATNLEFMFSKCTSLISVSDILPWKTNNVVNMNNMFQECSSLISLKDINKWDTSNVIKMIGIFEKCSSIEELPDISSWDLSNVTDISYMFNKCSNLISLPDISKWNTSKVVSIESIFQDCSSLLSLPDLSNWNINNNLIKRVI